MITLSSTQTGTPKGTDIHDHDESVGWQFEHSEVINEGRRLKKLEILPWVKIAVIGPSHVGFLGLVPLGLFQRMLRSLGLLLPSYFFFFFSFFLFLFVVFVLHFFGSRVLTSKYMDHLRPTLGDRTLPDLIFGKILWSASVT